jgi:putative transposase
MPRFSRIVIPKYPHHVVQRGNRLQKVFFSDSDKKAYLEFLKNSSQKHGLEIWAYCLMDNHVHLIIVPDNEKSLSKAIGEAHLQYTRMINFREGWRGYLWQGRFSSSCLDHKHLFAAIRYVETNPVRAGMVSIAENYQWSSARFHINKEKSDLLSDNFFTEEVKNWAEYLSDHKKDDTVKQIRSLVKTGKPLGDKEFIEKIEKQTGRRLMKIKPGPKQTKRK